LLCMSRQLMGNFMSECLSKEPSLSRILQGHLSQLMADVNAAVADAQAKYVSSWEISEKKLIFGEIIFVIGDRDDLGGFVFYQPFHRFVRNGGNPRLERTR